VTVLRVVRDPVQDSLRARTFAGRQEVAKVQRSERLPRIGRDAHDAIGMLDAGIDFSVDVLELIQVIDRPAIFGDFDVEHLMKRAEIEKAKRRSSITENEVLSILGQTPTLAFEMKGPEDAEAEAIVDEAGMGSPSELDEAALPVRESFGEVLLGNFGTLQNGANL
jgi:hypothetical protein